MEAGGATYPVWFGTNRKPEPAGVGFTNDALPHVPAAEWTCLVPEAHRFGELGHEPCQPPPTFRPARRPPAIQSVGEREREAFFSRNPRGYACRPRGRRPAAGAWSSLHGFNVSFEEAAIREAQIGCGPRSAGATAFFSWPSRGSVIAYPADEASIEASEQAITDFLVDFTSHCGAEKVHVIAHSMGNRALLRSLQRIAADDAARGRVKFGQIFLAAPDVDREVFLDLARLYPEHADRTTLYASDGDMAVHLSSKLHEAPRAGYYLPYTVVSGLDTVAVPNFDVDLLGHGYFAQAEALLHDIFDLMRHGEGPTRRQRIVAACHEGTSFWKLRL